MVLFHEYHSLSELGATMSDIAEQLNEAAKKATRASAQAEAWVNGPAGSFVETDSGQVPTIAELTRQNQEALPDVISYAGQAAASAGQAAASAALAGGIVEAAALPLPDVWAPLSDSLRMITGYGRDVLVGSDVVARMVNFSRSTTATYIGKDGQLKTAAVNEPRFEKEGLLIEGQSTNLFLNSENVALWPNPVGSASSTRELQAAQRGVVTCKVSAPSANGGVRQVHTAPTGGVHTVSFYLSKTSTPLRFILENGQTAWGADASASIAPATGTITGLIGITAAKSVAFSDGYIYQLKLPAGKVSGIVNAEWKTDASGDFYIGMLQLEALPFASSYIPTAGAAVTRAADVCDIPQAELNYRPAYNGRGPMTVAINFDVIGSHTDLRVLVTAETSGGTVSTHSLFAENSGAYSVSIGVRSIPAASTRVAKYIMDPSNNTVSVDGKSYVPYSGLTSTYQIRPNLSIGRRGVSNGNFLFGHVRNLRIYFAKLSDEQFKAVT